MAPEVGLEPTTTRLTAACSTIELLWNAKGRTIYKSPRIRQTDSSAIFMKAAFILNSAAGLPQKGSKGSKA